MKWFLPLALASLIVVGCQQAPNAESSSTPGDDKTASSSPSPRGPGEGEAGTNPDTPVSNDGSGTSETPGSTGGTSSAPSGGEGEATFAAANAIIQAKCMGCHGENGKEGLDVRSYESLMKGGEHGPVIVAGDPGASKIIMSLKGQGAKQMPLNQPPLSAEEIEVIEAWIKAGAKQ